jgi:ATP-binding cassette subfamily F protein uup
MNVLNVQELRKSFGPRVVFDGVSFAVNAGEKVGFIGANGSGKSTLFRIVAGLEGHQSGTVAFRRGTRVGYLGQSPEFQQADTVRSAISAGREWDHRAENVLTRLGVLDWDRPIAGSSGGEQKRVAIARVLLAEPDLLLLDEPTNHLDADTVEWLEGYLATYRGATLLITHDRYFLDRVVERMLEVSTGALTSFQGGYTEYLEAKAERAALFAATDHKRRRLIEQELAWVRRAPSARTGKQQARIGRLETLQAEQQFERSRAPAATAEITPPEAPRLGRTVLNIHEVSKHFGERVLFRPFTTLLQAGERIGIVGPNGAGKTTLLRILVGEEPASTGRVEVGVNTRMVYFDQTRGGLDPDASVYDSVANSDWVQLGGERVHLVSYLERFGFAPAIQRQAVRSLSGGERNRVLLARLFLEDANLLILDEPTNDLDLDTLRVLEDALANFAGCALLVSHDRFFLDKVATGLIVFEEDGTLRRHAGGYDLYRRLRAEREAAKRPPPAAAAAPRPGGAPARPSGGPRKLSYKETRELQGMEAAILAAEAERDTLSEELSTLAGSEWQATVRLTESLAAATVRVEELYARWAQLEEVASGS